MNYQVSVKNRSVRGTINLPASKSISNRVLIINALTKNPKPIRNLSDSDDTRVMIAAFNPTGTLIDIGHAGTAMRFLTAYFSQTEGSWELTGSERMKQRPIGILVDALNELGADIEYLETQGFPPLLIKGKKLKGKTIELDGSISSQYISAMLMIAPSLEGGLTLKLENQITSKPYIEMTLHLMEIFGVRHQWTANLINVPEQKYLPADFTVEADWSGASYLYQILALAENGELFLKNLRLESLQGDVNIARWFEKLGIKSVQKEKGVLLSKMHLAEPEKLNLDFIENPDIAQTMACLCVAKGIPFYFTGLKTLKIKETDRIAALMNELARFGAIITEPSEGSLAWDGKIDPFQKNEIPVIQTYHDHRMALAFAPMAMAGLTLQISDPTVVSKSYPGFWDDLKKTGFLVEEINPAG